MCLMPVHTTISGRDRGHVGHLHSRHASARRSRPPARGVPRGAAAALLGLGPVVGAILGEATGSYDGAVFAVLCVVSAAVAAVLVSSAGLWWAAPVPPPVIWAVSVLTELAWHNPPYQGGKEQAVGVAHGTIHAFPVMAASELAMAVVIAARVSAARRRGSTHV